VKESRLEAWPDRSREAAVNELKTSNYCTRCGGMLTLRWVPLEERLRDMCNRCGAVQYQNPRVLVSCYINWHDRVFFADGHISRVGDCGRHLLAL
jgi:ribosomal protein L37E